MFPNAGNPRKVQRYAAEWAEALRRMQALKPEVLIPGHGPVIFGAARCEQVLDDGATLLESLVGQTLALMNRGCTLDEVLHGVAAPAGLLAKPYLRPQYDDPEFIVRAIWHLYGGWFDGNPAHLKPAPAAELASELATLAGGAARLAERAAVLADAGRTRLAVHLAELAAGAAPADKAIQATRAKVLEQCMERETSLMGRAFLAVYQRDARARAGD
jgi:alkyl sulfatase BDS1-like metallo-beta-lactamase superfamily hydrolase